MSEEIQNQLDRFIYWKKKELTRFEGSSLQVQAKCMADQSEFELDRMITHQIQSKYPELWKSQCA